MATLLKNISIFLCIAFHGNVVLSGTSPNQKSTSNLKTFAKMALGGAGMSISAGITLYGFFGGNYIINADKRAFSRFTQSLVGNYYSPFITESGAFTLTSPFSSALIFPYFLSVFQQGYQAYRDENEAPQDPNSKMKTFVSKVLECCKIGVSSINFFPLLSVVSEIYSFDDDGCWDPKPVGLTALFALSAASLSCDTITESIARLRNKPLTLLKNNQRKSTAEKLWLLTQLATGFTGMMYGSEGMYQSIMNEMFKKHGFLYSIPALSITTAYMLISGNLANKGWSKI